MSVPISPDVRPEGGRSRTQWKQGVQSDLGVFVLATVGWAVPKRKIYRSVVDARLPQL